MKALSTLTTSFALAAFTFAAAPLAQAETQHIEVSNIDTIIEAHPLTQDGPPASVIGRSVAGDSELQVLVMRNIRLHHHEQEDHVVYVVRGEGTARLENADGELEEHSVQAGDIFNLPRNRKHAFEKSGDEDIVMLVVATAGWKPLEDTVFHE